MLTQSPTFCFLLAHLIIALFPLSIAQLEGTSTTAVSDFRIPVPLWTQNRSVDLVLNFSKADAAAQAQEAGAIKFRGKHLKSVSLKKGYFHGNIAVVRFGTQYITAVRKIQFYITPRSSVPHYPLDKDPSECEVVVVVHPAGEEAVCICTGSKVMLC